MSLDHEKLGVNDQVNKHLLHLEVIKHYSGQVGIKSADNFNVLGFMLSSLLVYKTRAPGSET
jgi:hypothetical protein